jgi:regulator of protease activity HflC (stomatin/prohibitin superfamily)
MITDILLILVTLVIVAGAIAPLVITKFRHIYIVPEGWTGLLYCHGLYVRRNNAGRHIIWGRGWKMTLTDLRRASLLVPGQDVLTSDSIGLKFSLLVRYQITEPAKAAHETQNWLNDLYSLTQVALRTVVNGIASEVLLNQNQKLEIGEQLLARVKPGAEKLGVDVLAVEVRDVVFPPDLKRAFAEVLKAKHEGQAALERARGETAALRNLANAARVLDGNPALMNLRLMQSLASAQNAGSTLVLGMPGGFVPLKNGGTPKGTETNENRDAKE